MNSPKKKLSLQKYYQKNKVYLDSYRHKRYIKSIPIYQKIMTELKINGCAICGYNESTFALEFHHTNPKSKKFNLATLSGLSRSESSIVDELNKCILLCSNCHKKITWGDKY
jgi:5-methylcytosine-specific restriction endonuclease McrA